MRTLDLLAAFDPSIEQRKNCPTTDNSRGCVNVLPQVSASENQVQNGLTVVFGVIAAVAIVVIIVAAINLANSEGNPDNISRGKKTIVFALLGLVIALSAEVIVLTLLGRF